MFESIATESETGTSAVDVLRYESADGPRIRTVPAGTGQVVVDAHVQERRKRRVLRRLLEVVLAAVVAGYALLADRLVLGALGLVAIGILFAVTDRDGVSVVPELVERNLPRERAERLYDVETHAETVT